MNKRFRTRLTQVKVDPIANGNSPYLFTCKVLDFCNFAKIRPQKWEIVCNGHDSVGLWYNTHQDMNAVSTAQYARLRLNDNSDFAR